MHRAMMYLFLELITNRVQFGSFAMAFNSIYKVQYYRKASYCTARTTSPTNNSRQFFAMIQITLKHLHFLLSI